MSSSGKPLFVIIAPTSKALGFGHMARAKRYADEIRARGGSVLFLDGDDEAARKHQMELIAQGYDAACLSGLALPTNANDEHFEQWYAGRFEQQDTSAYIDYLKQNSIQPDGLLVSNYTFSADSYARFKEAFPTIRDDFVIAIGDQHYIQNFGPIPRHIVIETCFSGTRAAFEGMFRENAEFICGPQGLTPDPRILTIDKDLTQTNANILVNFGGTDAGNLTATALGALQTLYNKGMTYLHPTVIVGMLDTAKAVREYCAPSISSAFADRISFQGKTNDMPDFISENDIYLGAAGLVMLENMTAGNCCVVAGAVQIQQLGADFYASQQAVLNCGSLNVDRRDVIQTRMQQNLETVLKNPALARTYRERAFHLFDDLRTKGPPARRIIGALDFQN